MGKHIVCHNKTLTKLKFLSLHNLGNCFFLSGGMKQNFVITTLNFHIKKHKTQKENISETFQEDFVTFLKVMSFYCVSFLPAACIFISFLSAEEGSCLWG